MWRSMTQFGQNCAVEKAVAMFRVQLSSLFIVFLSNKAYFIKS